jgi:hypothetical protein
MEVATKKDEATLVGQIREPGDVDDELPVVGGNGFDGTESGDEDAETSKDLKIT